MSSSLMVISGDSLMAGSSAPGGGGALADDLFFVPDNTHYIGYDTVGVAWGRPRTAYVMRDLNIGGSTAGTYQPVLNFIQADSGAAPGQTVGGYLQYNASYGMDLVNATLADGASAVVARTIYDVNAASITNAATMRIHSFGWLNNADAYTELGYIRADGAVVCASGSLSTGIQPAGLSNDFGIATTAVTDTLSLWSTRTSGAGNVGIAVVADVNAASIAAGHKVMSFQWVNDSDTATELAYLDGNAGFVNSHAWAIGATATDGLTLDNTTAAAAGAQQYSPAIHLGGNCWETTGGTSQSVDWRIYNVPVQGATSSTTLYFDSSVNGAAYTNRMTLTSGGYLSLQTGVIAPAFYSPSSSYLELRGNTNSSTGLSTAENIIANAAANPLLLVHAARTDGASNVVAATVYDRNAASITNAATMRIHSFGWTNNADAYGELAYVRADGLIYGALGFDSSKAWAIGTTPTDGLTLDNTTAAAVGAQQYSPAIHLGGNCWETTGGTSQSVDWRIYNVPVQGATATTTLTFAASINGAAYSAPYTFTSAGTCTASAAFVAGGSSMSSGQVYLGACLAYESGTNRSTGLGTTAHDYLFGVDRIYAIINAGRADSASNVVIASVYDVNAASITNAATMRIHSFGWTTNADAYTELSYMRADGAIVCASGSLSMGIQPAGVSTDFGVATTAATDTLSLWSIRTNGSGNISHAIVADVNNATLHADHKVLSIGWVNNADSYTELFAFKDGQIVYSNVTGGMEFWSDEADGGSAVAFTVGSTNSWTTAGAKLLSVVNTDPAGYERFYVGYNGDVCVNKGNNAQCLNIKSLTESLTIAAAATTTAVNQIPQYAIVLAVSVRVTTVIPTATDFSVGISGDATRYGSTINVAAGTTNPGTQDAARYYNTATSIIITPQASPAAATGVVRLTIHYLDVTPPTS